MSTLERVTTVMKVAIITDSIEKGPISSGNYAKSFIKELLKIKGDNIEIILIHAQKNNDPIYKNTKEVIVPFPKEKKHTNFLLKLFSFAVYKILNFSRNYKILKICEKEKIDVVIIVHNETSTGVKVVDLPEICRVAKEHGALTIVDAVSILGGDELPVDKWNIDICVTGSQKCLACPPGLALISVSEDAWKAIKRVENRPYYFDLLRVKSYYDEKREHPFTPALPIMFALNEALQIIVEEGLEKRFERHRKCAEAFYNAVEAFGMSVFPKEKNIRSNTVIAVNIPENVDDASVRNVMREKYKVLIAGGMGKLKGKIFRIGCMGIISPAEVLITLNAFGNALKDVGYEVEIEKGIEAARKVFQS